MKCYRARCASCKCINITNKIKSKTYNLDYEIIGRMNCATKNGIYAVQNSRTGDLYFGSTIQEMSRRQNVHRNYKQANMETIMDYSEDEMELNLHSLHYYSFTPYRLISLKGNASEDILFNEYRLNHEERNAQARFGTVHSGLNGTSDYYNTNDTRRMKNISDKIVQTFAVLYRRY